MQLALTIALLLVTELLDAQGVLRMADQSDRFALSYALRIPTGLPPRLPETFPGKTVPIDFDRDGDQDILLTYGPLRDDSTGFAINRLFRNDGTSFVDVTILTGLDLVLPAGNAEVGDVDGDGYPDLYLSRLGNDILLKNDSGSTFIDVTSEAGINNPHWSTAAKFFDANGDGALDLYIANYLDYPVVDTLICRDPMSGEEVLCDPEIYDPAPNLVYLNDGNGHFREAQENMGFADSAGRSLDIVLLQSQGTRRLELLVLNSFGPNYLYVASDSATWVESAWAAGLAVAPNGEDRLWKQVVPVDANDDGLTDILFVDVRRNFLFMINNGAGQYFSGEYQSGLFRPIHPISATLGLVVDTDFDRRPDLMIVDAGNDTLPTAQFILRGKPDGTYMQVPIDFDLAIDTLLARPFLTVTDEGTFEDFLGDVSGPIFDRRALAESDTVESLVAFTDTTTGALAPQDSAILDSVALDSLLMVSAMIDSLAIDSVGIAETPSLLDSSVATDTTRNRVSVDISSVWTEWDTVAVREVPAEIVQIDLDLDGVPEIIASYPSGLIKVWAMGRPERLNFVGIVPTLADSGGTAIGSTVEFVGKDKIDRHLIVDTAPIVIYPSSRTKVMTVRVTWPDGLITMFRLPEMRRYYSLSRAGVEPL